MSQLPHQAVDRVGAELAGVLLDNVGNRITEALLNGIVAVFKSNLAQVQLDLAAPEGEKAVQRLTAPPSGNLLPEGFPQFPPSR